MAPKFCRQCSIRLLGEDSKDFAGLSKKEDTHQGYFPVVLCEGCGLIQVDHTGKCVSIDCLGVHAQEEKKINFKRLLEKYMRLVNNMEGVDFIDEVGRAESHELGITFEEWAILEDIHEEISE